MSKKVWHFMLGFCTILTLDVSQHVGFTEEPVALGLEFTAGTAWSFRTDELLASSSLTVATGWQRTFSLGAIVLAGRTHQEYGLSLGVDLKRLVAHGGGSWEWRVPLEPILSAYIARDWQANVWDYGVNATLLNVRF